MLLSVPSGKGKSRIIAAIIALQAEFNDRQHFTIVYSSRLLMSANEKRYKQLAITLGKPIEQIVFDPSVPLQEQLDGDSYVLIDEADHILLDKLATLDNSHVVGLSATPATANLAMETAYLSKHGFETVDSKIAGYIYPNTSVKSVTIHQFMHDSEGMARLVYAREAAEASFRLAVKNIKATDSENLQELGNM